MRSDQHDYRRSLVKSTLHPSREILSNRRQAVWDGGEPDPVAPTILVVEDDAMTRISAALLVEDAGYPAIVAENADAAMLALEAHPEIGALFTDVHMPGSMDGLELAAEARRLWPDIEILLASGRSNPPKTQMPFGAMFLSKPYTGTEVSLSLLHLLPRGPGRPV
jgi:CheY-like chemotaxis protein